MKKSNLIITIAVVIVLAASSVGAILAASGVFAAGSAPVQSTAGAINFTAESGIRWNNGKGVFEIFNWAGFTYVSSNEWVSLTGETKPNATYGTESAAAVAGFYLASPLKTYHLMQDITYEQTAARFTGDDRDTKCADLGANGEENSKGVFDGRGFGIYYPIVRSGSCLFNIIFGTVQNLNIVLNISKSDVGHVAAYCLGIKGGRIANCTTSGFVDAKNAVSGFVLALDANPEGVLIDCKNFARLTSIATIDGASGIIVLAGATLELQIINCKNYGNITGGISAGIQAGGHPINVKIISCVNFGNIISRRSDRASGGIQSVGSNQPSTVLNCVNYGSIEHELDGKWAAGIVGSFVKITTGDNILECRNYGTVTATNKYDLYWGQA